MAPGSDTPFPFDVVAELSADPERVRRYLEEYFRRHDGLEQGFTGRFFEQFLARSDPDRFIAFDLVAVSTLSVTIPAGAASVILLDPVTSASLNRLLVQVPPAGVDLADTELDDIADNSPLSQLYVAMPQLPGMGPTRTSKLLASKRPGVVPIRDSVVSTLLQAGDRWWQPMRELARDQGLRNMFDTASIDVVPPLSPSCAASTSSFGDGAPTPASPRRQTKRHSRWPDGRRRPLRQRHRIPAPNADAIDAVVAPERHVPAGRP